MRAILAFAVACLCLAPLSAHGAEQPSVQVDLSNLQSPRPLQKETQNAAIRDYLKAWRSLGEAFARNQPELLDADFVGTARQKFGDAIQEQVAGGISTRYQDRAHRIQIVFYSPEGLSIQIVDNVDYVVDVSSGDKLHSQQLMHARYVAVLTPAEVRWRVRLLQGGPQK
jgi:hypothetical protein